MTDKLKPLLTHIAPPNQIISATPTSTTVTSHNVPHKVETVEEEPYTIKCICGYEEDDGNTIFCEQCDTWQHIECFYPNNAEDVYREDFSHSCADCKPRNLPSDQARERQRLRLSMTAVSEVAGKRPSKRPPSKGTKKKIKPADLQLNSQPGGQEGTKHGSPNDQIQQSSKKVKPSHRPSQSVSSKRSPSYTTTKTTLHGHPPSPATTPPDLPSDFEIHNYSTNFLSLYSDDDIQEVQTNSFANLMISNAMSLWLREPEKMRQETGQEYKDVFQFLPSNIDKLKRAIQVERKKLPLSPGTVLRYLSAPSAVDKDVPLVELSGQIGFQKDYCADPENRWDELTSPLPFVFFHPMLPLYIDTRKEGSAARYVRRSCKPNAVLDTFLSGGSEYHFWLVSDRHIGTSEQITIPWDFRFPKKAKARMLRLLGLGDEDHSVTDDSDIDDAEYQNIANWLHVILSEYGGCACDLGGDCAFTRFHRNYYGKAQTRSNAGKKKSRKPRTNAMSPTSTGHATNSRAPSESHLEDGLDQDARSVSGSSRSKPPSRDETPLRQGSFDTLGILTEPTDRDKRKVAMVEDSFRRMEQQLPAKKKKRTSDGTGPPIPKSKPANRIMTQSGGVSNGVSDRSYVDAGTSRSKHGSPASTASPHSVYTPRAALAKPCASQVSRHGSTSARLAYCDACVQTDPVEGEWYSTLGKLSPKPRRRLVSLSRRLLNSRHRCRLDEEKQDQGERFDQQQAQMPTSMEVDSPSADNRVSPSSPTTSREDHDRNAASVSPAAAEPNDTAMTDVPSTSPATKPRLPHVTTSMPRPIKISKSPELRVQMPPVPAFGSPTSISTTTTPLSASSMIQSPFSSGNLPSPFAPSTVNGLAANPSPVKKKLSLSDYTKSRMNKTSGKLPGASLLASLKPSSAIAEESKAVGLDGAPLVDSSITEKTAEPASVAPSTPASGVAPTTNGAL